MNFSVSITGHLYLAIYEEHDQYKSLKTHCPVKNLTVGIPSLEKTHIFLK